MKSSSLERTSRWLATLACAILMTACGGGGGGGSTGGGVTPPPPVAVDDFKISLSATPLVISAEEGTAVPPVQLQGTVSGTQPAALYTGGDDQGTAIDHVTVDVAGTKLTVNVFAKSTLAPGTYTGSLKLYACADQACSKNFAGSPTSVPYTVTITKGFKVTPQSLSLSALSGATASADVSVQPQEGQSSFTASSSTDWLKVSKVTATGITLTAGSMPPGNYVGTARVDSGTRTKDITVNYAVTADQTTVTQIIPSVTSLNFTAPATGTSAAQRVDVTLPSWTTVLNATVNYAGSASNWLTLTQVGDRSFSLSASAANLPLGTYSANLVLSSGPSTTPVTVPVSFAVGTAAWSVSGVRSFSVNQDTTAAQLGTTVTVDIPGLQPQQWSASSNAAWLVLTQSSGTTGTGQLKAVVDLAQLRSLPNFATYSADVTLSSPNPQIPSTKVPVTLVKAVPELRYLSPYTRMPNESGNYTLRGRGFSSLAQPAQALQVTGATPLAVTLVSDTEMTVRLPGAASGSVFFAIPNQLGIDSATPELKVVAPSGYAYQAIATTGRKGGLVFDPVGQALYTANGTQGTVMRFSYDGSRWNTDTVALPGADMAALSPDGKLVVATSTSSKSVVLLDAVTLANRGTYTTSTVGGAGPYLAPRLGVMNDGRAFFQGAPTDGLTYFDINSRSFGSIPGNYSFNGGPWFNVSGDGSRMLIVQAAGATPAPPMLYMNSTDTATKVNPAGLDYWYDATQSLRGERFVDDNLRVWDRDFTLVGNLRIPGTGNYFARLPVLSPDGNRAYVLAYADPTAAPRVYVFDTSTRVVSTAGLPLLGFFTLADYPSCNTDLFDFNCSPSLRGTVSPDGKTLFFIGDTKLVITPIPALTASPTATDVSSKMRLTVPRH